VTETPKSGFLAAVLSAIFRPLVRHLDKVSHPKYRGNLTVAGLHEKVKVVWQSHGIPHVFANSEHDLFLAQGYLHAQERLWQMDMSRRFLTGRMAEVFGNFSLPWKELSRQFRGRDSADFDYFMRLVGVSRSANASLALLSDADQRRLQAYSEGVNRYIEHCRNKLPWEFRILFYEPEPWRPEDSLTIGKGFAFLLSTALFTRLNMIALSARLHDQPEKLRSLMPFYPENEPTITRAVWDSLKNIWHFVNETLPTSDLHPAGHGSNNWVVAPHRSTSGSAILCNDPHLRLTLPSIWYLMHLKAEPHQSQPDSYEVWGATIPGTPCVQIGHNRRISWGTTAALCDDVELYREKLHRLDSSRYRVGYEWHSFENREEIIRVRWGKEIRRTIRSTRHGPLISDFQTSPSSSEALAFRWTAHDPSQEVAGLYKLNRARDWSEFLDSLSYATAPSLNYVYADNAGNIGYSLAGKIPIRSKAPSLLPVEGWDPSNEWHGYIPFNELPRLYNPQEGVIATANNKVVDSSFPYYLSHFFEPPYRVARIKQLLSQRAQFSTDDMARIQADVISVQATALIEALRLDLQRASEEIINVKSAADRLLGWDGQCDENSVESAIYHVLHQRLLANLLVPVLGEELFSAYVEIFNQCIMPTDQILKNSASSWFRFQSRYDLVARSLREACDQLHDGLGDDFEAWQWGKIHHLILKHSLGRINILKPLLAIGPSPSPGDGTTINMGFYRHSQPYEHTVGASLRIIIDAGHLENSGYILAAGQSGHPTSHHFRDQNKLWQQHLYIQFLDTEQTTSNQPSLSLMPLLKRN